MSDAVLKTIITEVEDLLLQFSYDPQFTLSPKVC